MAYASQESGVRKHLKDAESNGYVECAFGLKVRTPILAKSLMGSKFTPKEAAAESRTAGNALGQSWCLLNCRAANEVMEKVWNSPYKTDILPVAQIHDALYFFVKDDLDVLVWFNKVLIEAMEWQEDPVVWFNKVLIEAMEWQEDPVIAHDEVKLGGDLEIFWPDWSHGIEIPNNATKEDIVRILENEASNK